MISENFSIIQSSIGEKFSNIIFTLANVVSGLVIAFTKGPLFAIICFAYFPFMLIGLSIFGGVVKRASMAKL
jgi:ABC-type multidrug transport system fused ATPase/permease subunit